MTLIWERVSKKLVAESGATRNAPVEHLANATAVTNAAVMTTACGSFKHRRTGL